MEQFQYYQKQAYVTLSRCARHAGAEVEMRYGSWNTTVQQLEGGMSSGDSEPLVAVSPLVTVNPLVVVSPLVTVNPVVVPGYILI